MDLKDKDYTEADLEDSLRRAFVEGVLILFFLMDIL